MNHRVVLMLYPVYDWNQLLQLLLQKHAKYVESGLKAVKARNEYILCLEAANAAVQKYFSDDIHDLINVRLPHFRVEHFWIFAC